MNDLNEINKEDVNFKAYPVKVEFDNMLVDVRVNFDADYKMEGHVERHNHSSYEIHFISYGNGSFWIEDSEVLLRKTSLYLLSPKIYHRFVVKNEEQIERYSMQFDFQYLKKTDDNPQSDISLKVKKLMDKNKFLVAEDFYDNFNIIKHIYNELKLQKIFYVQNVNLLVKQVMINIFRTIHENNFSNLMDGYENEPDERRISKMEQFFHEHYMQGDIKIDDLARTLNLSVRQTQRLIKKLFNISFKEKIIVTRIENAKHFLITTNLSIEVISELVGFNSLNYFYSVFKGKTGMTPKTLIHNSSHKKKCTIVKANL